MRHRALWMFVIVALTFALPVAAPASAAPSGELNARARAVAPGPDFQASWSTGAVAAGASQNWVWNNANPLSAAYQVGFTPAGASAASPCQFTVARTWYSQQPGGERKFHVVIRNAGAVTCTATVVLSWLTSTQDWALDPIAPGATVNWGWFEQVPPTLSYLAGIAPSGATATAACQLEITRTWYEQVWEAGQVHRDFNFVIKNVGTVTCRGQLHLVEVPTSTSWSTGTLAGGASATWTWNNANPLNLVYLPAVSPLGATTTNPCKMEVTRRTYVQRINPDGTAQRQFVLTVTNVGWLACSGKVLLGSVSA